MVRAKMSRIGSDFKMESFSKTFKPEFHCALQKILVKIRAFNIEILHMLIVHKICGKRIM